MTESINDAKLNNNFSQEPILISQKKLNLNKNIIETIKESLNLKEQDLKEINDIDADSKISVTTSSNSSEDNFLNSVDYFIFEENYKKYYVDSSKNVSDNFDFYVKNALKLISVIPFNKISIESKIKNISNELYKNYKTILSTKPKNNKKTLILDLDETLIHSDIDFLSKTKNYDVELEIFDDIENQNVPLPLFLRPGLFEFLEYASKNFELVVYTASQKIYADTIINYIEKNKKYFSMRLYHNSCIFIEPGLFIKDLRIFLPYRKMENIILVDNSLFAFCNQLNNGILITSFFEDKKDNILQNLEGYLEMIKNVNDVREINKESFQFEQYKHDIIMKSDI